MLNAKHFTHQMNINELITDSIYEKHLTKEKNHFFNLMQNKQQFDLNTAYRIAHNWREITKNFLFTSIEGLGVLSAFLKEKKSAAPELLALLQRSFSIISDDLGHTSDKKFPYGIYGIHFIWWENTILKPLTKQQVFHQNDQLTKGTLHLVEKMHKLCNSFYLGVAVQLKVVETIAYDICVAFLHLFSQVIVDGNLFFKQEQLQWITTHLSLEQLHHAQVSGDQYMNLACFPLHDENYLSIETLISEYTQAWSHALNDFAKIAE